LKHKLTYIACILSLTILHGQNLVNGDLEGPVTALSEVPAPWVKVPYTDVNCLALSNGSDTPDLCDINGPMASSGIFGQAYSGNSFISGLYSATGPTHLHWHEGIMQDVDGFIQGCTYEISFYQTVVKQGNSALHLDSSGSWAVYLDDVLLGISAPTTGHQDYDDPDLSWERRSFTFVATRNDYRIKFLPADDDNNWWMVDPYAGLRMGLDMIEIERPIQSANILGPDTTVCDGLSLLLDASQTAGNYTWQDQSTSSDFQVDQNGIYWVLVDDGCSYYRDSIEVRFDSLPLFQLPADSSICRGDTIFIPEGLDSYDLMWSHGTSDEFLSPAHSGTYYLIVSNDCGTHQDEIVLDVNRCYCEVHIPNAFSPNGDVWNPGFLTMSECNFAEFEIHIYDRWGQQVFHSLDPLEAWDGTQHGKDCETGVYVYFLTYKFPFSPIFRRSGDITLLR
jgi:gliding motility-associated-like protein